MARTEFTYRIEDAKISRADVSASEWALLLANSHDPEGYENEDSLFIDVDAVIDAKTYDNQIAWDCDHFFLDDGTKIDGGAIYRAMPFPEASIEDAAFDELRVEWLSYGGADYTAGGKWVEAF